MLHYVAKRLIKLSFYILQHLINGVSRGIKLQLDAVLLA